MEPPLDRKGRETLDAPLKPDEDVEFIEGVPHVTRAPKGPPATNTVIGRQRVLTLKALVRLAEGDRMIDIAEEFQMPVNTLIGWIARFKRKLKEAEIDQRLDQIALPLATDNLIHGLLAGDKDYTLETLKGRGKLRRYTNADETVHHDLPTLHIQFEPPAESAGYTPEQIALGRVVGRAALPAPATAGEVLDSRVLNAEYQVETVVAEQRAEHDPDE